MAKAYDVVIVGAGPSGSTLARLLAREGFLTLLLDKEKFPRCKPCGGLVSVRALRELDFKVDEVTKVVYTGAKVFRPRGGYINLRSDSPFVIGVSRVDFDSYLVKEAIAEGVDFRDNRMVQDISVTSEGTKIMTNKGLAFNSKIVVGADGVNSIVARAVGIRKGWHPSEVGSCIVAEEQLDKELVNRLCPEPVLEFYFGLTHTGYSWIFPKEDMLNIGMGAFLSEQKITLELFNSFITNNLRLKKSKIRFHPRFHLLPIGGIERDICADRTLLIGDAGGFVDPLYGEGIFYAISSAKEALKAIIKSLDENDFSKEVLLEYEKNCKSSIIPELQYGYHIAKKVHFYPNFTLKLFMVDQKLRSNLIRHLRGDINYRTFYRNYNRRLPINLIKSII